MITVIAVGKKHQPYIAEGITTFSKRLERAYEIKWAWIRPSGLNDIQAAKKHESAQILNQLAANQFVILLDETGQMFDSPALAEIIDQHLSTNLTFIIGGAYGVNDAIKQRANLIWSLSKLVFPHQIVGLLLTEQIYRAQTINRGHGYHHL